MRYFKVRYGYEKSAFTTIEEGGDLERAIYAWTEQIPVTLGDRMIHGRSILAIEPYYNAHTGWDRLYEPKDADDWQQIKRDCPKYDGIIENYKNHVLNLIENNQTEQIGNGNLPKKQIENPVTKNMYQIENGKIKQM
jgi:hypothetical protein